MGITLDTPDVDGLDAAVRELRDWQHADAPMQLHSGDLGWYYRLGAEATAAAVRTWSRDGRIVVVGLLDGPGLIRLTLAPDVWQDEELARRLADDLITPERGVLPAGRANVEAPTAALIQTVLAEAGWDVDEPWTPLRRDLAAPVEDPGVRVEVAGPEHAQAYADVVRSAFDGSTFSAERWHAMAAGSPYADARSLIAYSGDHAAAAITVWSAGPGKPGLIEPLGVHPDHRKRGYGRAISVAAAATLRAMGSSSALVCTPSSNVGAVATYRAAGFQPLPEVRDRYRP